MSVTLSDDEYQRLKELADLSSELEAKRDELREENSELRDQLLAKMRENARQNRMGDYQ